MLINVITRYPVPPLDVARYPFAHPIRVRFAEGRIVEANARTGSDVLAKVLDTDEGAARLGEVALVICLDSGAGNYDQLWLTTSLRGIGP